MLIFADRSIKQDSLTHWWSINVLWWHWWSMWECCSDWMCRVASLWLPNSLDYGYLAHDSWFVCVSPLQMGFIKVIKWLQTCIPVGFPPTLNWQPWCNKTKVMLNPIHSRQVCLFSGRWVWTTEEIQLVFHNIHRWLHSVSTQSEEHNKSSSTCHLLPHTEPWSNHASSQYRITYTGYIWWEKTPFVCKCYFGEHILRLDCSLNKTEGIRICFKQQEKFLYIQNFVCKFYNVQYFNLTIVRPVRVLKHLDHELYELDLSEGTCPRRLPQEGSWAQDYISLC